MPHNCIVFYIIIFYYLNLILCLLNAFDAISFGTMQEGKKVTDTGQRLNLIWEEKLIKISKIMSFKIIREVVDST